MLLGGGKHEGCFDVVYNGLSVNISITLSLIPLLILLSLGSFV